MNSPYPTVRRKVPHIKTCTQCFERKPAYVVIGDTCTKCISVLHPILSYQD